MRRRYGAGAVGRIGLALCFFAVAPVASTSFTVSDRSDAAITVYKNQATPVWAARALARINYGNWI